MEAVNPDKYDFNISPLPAGFYIKSVRAERTDVLLSGLDLTNGAPPALTVVLSANAGQLTGAAQNPDTQKGAAAVTVVLAPQEKERREVMAFYKTANTDQNGSFTIRGITPGEYKIYAWEDLEPGAYMDPDVMKPVESKGVSVTIKEGSSENVMVNMIPADSPAAVNGQAGKL
jgi:uncharacterized protein (DUF2141 family)